MLKLSPSYMSQVGGKPTHTKLPDDFFSDEYVASRQNMWGHTLNNPREEWRIRVAKSAGTIIGFACGRKKS